MSALRIYYHNDTANLIFASHNNISIHRRLKQVGVRFEQWYTDATPDKNAAPDTILAAYQTEIQRLTQLAGYQQADIIRHCDQAEMREDFLHEHTHSEDEVLFFIAGEGLFSLHIDENVYEVHCTAGDFISIPAHTPHWFDMGNNPNFTAIRLFNLPAGRTVNFTGNKIANKFNRLEN